MDPGELVRGRIASCEWEEDSTLLTYRVPGIHEVNFHEVLLLVLGSEGTLTCPYHRNSPTWDDCTEGYNGSCVVRAVKDELRRKED